MKDCNKCEYFNGYCEDDGTPRCEYESDNGYAGYECCPFNDTAEVKDSGFSCTIDLSRMDDYISNTISNTIANRVNAQIDLTVRELIKSEYAETIKKKTVAAIDAEIEKQIACYMGEKITVGGGWSEPERTLSRTEYLSETISKELGTKFKTDTIRDLVVGAVKAEIEKRTTSLKDQINIGIKTTFDEVTRKTLAENVVSMLMCSDTYTKLQNGMAQMLK